MTHISRGREQQAEGSRRGAEGRCQNTLWEVGLYLLALTSGLVNAEEFSLIGLPSSPSQPGTGQELSGDGWMAREGFPRRVEWILGLGTKPPLPICVRVRVRVVLVLCPGSRCLLPHSYFPLPPHLLHPTTIPGLSLI